MSRIKTNFCFAMTALTLWGCSPAFRSGAQFSSTNSNSQNLNDNSSSQYNGSSTFVLVGNEGSADLSMFWMNTSTGALTALDASPLQLGAGPSSMTFDPSGKFVYIADDIADQVNAYSMDGSTGTFSPVPGSPYPVGSTPWCIATDPAGKFVFVGNYASYSISVFSRNATTGALSEIAGSPFNGPQGPGYSGMVIDITGSYLYVSENDNYTLYAFNIAANGSLTPMTTSEYGVGLSPIPTVITPNGKFLYSTGWSTGGIHGFTINNDGTLTSTGAATSAGTNPFGAAIDPSGNYLYVVNQNSNDIDAYLIDPTNGTLSAVAGSPFAAGGSPHSIAFDPSGKFAYVANNSGNTVSAYSMSGGVLTPLASPVAATYPVGTNPSVVRVINAP